MTIFGDPLWAEMFSIFNIVFALILGYNRMRLALREKGFGRFINVSLSILGFYWAAIYVFVLVTTSGTYDSVAFGQIFVRPAFNLTLAVLASAAVYREVIDG